MLNTDSRNILRLFPWDICRRIYANPTNDHIYTINGVSYDWEHLLSSSFVDAKTIIREWLVYRRRIAKPDEVDYFTDLFIPHTEEDFKSTVYARAILFQDHNYFGIIAMSYLYLCGVYLEENDILAVFCALNYPSQPSNVKDNLISDEGLSVSVPHWYTLAKWLQRACDDLSIFNIGGISSITQHTVDSQLNNSPHLNSNSLKNISKKRQRNVFNMAQMPSSNPATVVPPLTSSTNVGSIEADTMFHQNSASDKTLDYNSSNEYYNSSNIQNNAFFGMKTDSLKPNETNKNMRLPVLPSAETNMLRYNNNNSTSDALDVINNLSSNSNNNNNSNMNQKYAQLGSFAQSNNNNNGFPQNNAGMNYNSVNFQPIDTNTASVTNQSNGSAGAVGFNNNPNHKVNNSYNMLPNNSSYGMPMNNINNNSLLGNLALNNPNSSIGVMNSSLSNIGGSSVGIPGFSSNYTDQLMISNLISQNILNQQQLNQHSQQQMVNRRQKRNRDKFKFTFQLSQEQATDLLSKQLVNETDLIPAAEYEENLKALIPQLEADNCVITPLFTSPGDVFYSILVPLKGIDVLPNRRYRVQLNTFMQGRKKFSRNSLDLYEALWIFEIALLISDSPTQLIELQRIGNYNCLSMLGYLRFFSSSSQYYMELGRHIMLFYDTLDFFNEELITVAIKNFDALKPAFEYAPLEPLANFLSKTSSVGSSSGGGTLLSNTVVQSETLTNKPTTEIVEDNYKEPVWMLGFHKALSLKDQKLSCLYCFRRFPIPVFLPRISMIRDKDEKLTVNAAIRTTSVATTAPIPVVVLQTDEIEEEQQDVDVIEDEEEEDDDDDVIFVDHEEVEEGGGGVYSESFSTNDHA